MIKKLGICLLIMFALCSCAKKEDEDADYFIRCARSEAKLRVDNLYGFDSEKEYTLRVHVLDSGKIPYYFYVEEDGEILFGMEFIFQKEDLPEDVATYKYKAGWLYAQAENFRGESRQPEFWDKHDETEKINDIFPTATLKRISKELKPISAENMQLIMEDLPLCVEEILAIDNVMDDAKIRIEGFCHQIALNLTSNSDEMVIVESDMILAFGYIGEEMAFIISYDGQTGQRNAIVEANRQPQLMESLTGKPVMIVNSGERPYDVFLPFNNDAVYSQALVNAMMPLPITTRLALPELCSIANQFERWKVLYEN